MNKILMILTLFAIACSDNARVTAKRGHEQEDTITEVRSPLRLNNGARWKTDEATRKNVAAIVKVMNDSNNFGTLNRSELKKQLQVRIDTLVQQCKMDGPDHEALHLWLSQVIQDINGEKLDDAKWHADLKKDVDSFYVFFE
jgi:hypothetical protein